MIVVSKQTLFEQLAAKFKLLVLSVVVREFSPGTFTAAITVASPSRKFPSSSNEATFYGDLRTSSQDAIDSAYGEALTVLAEQWKLTIVDYNYDELLRVRKMHQRAESWSSIFEETCIRQMQRIGNMETDQRKNAGRIRDILYKYRTMLPVEFNTRNKQEGSYENSHNVPVYYAGVTPPNSPVELLSHDLIELASNLI